MTGPCDIDDHCGGETEDQAYYWSYAWQDAERKAMADLHAGRARTFNDPDAAARYLLANRSGDNIGGPVGN